MANTNITEKTSFEKRLAAYGAMSLAFAAVAAPSAAQAGQVSYLAGITNSSDLPAIYFDLTTGGFGTQAHAGWFDLLTDIADLRRVARIEVSSSNQAFAITGSAPAHLAPGAAVGPGLTFGTAFSTLASNSASPFGNWNGNGAPADLGFSYLLGGDKFYGWAEISVDPTSYLITLRSFGRSDTSGQAAISSTTPTPEPASIVLLCLGAAGLATWRRKTRSA